MTTITVSASDTAQAMDKIIERLGDDAMILETIKRDGRIEMIATDDTAPAPLPSPRGDIPDEAELAFANRPANGRSADGLSANGLSAVEGGLTGIPQSKPVNGLDVNIGASTAFTDLLDQQMVETIKARSTADHLTDRTASTSSQMDILDELRDLRSMLNGMMLTRPEGLDVTLGHAAPVRLQQAGFSPQVIHALHHHMTGLDHDDAVDAFMNALADRVIHNHAESVFDAKLVCVVGSSGSGKTTLATKIAAYFKENGISERITLASATGQGIGQNEDIKSYARLLNMRSTDFGIGELATAIQETSNRMIVDVDAGSSDALEAILAARQHLGRGRVSVVQAVPGGSSATMITHQCRLFQKLKPLIALTKLDECETRPAELSALALEGSGVGLLTGTTAIVGGIAIATTPILAQYLKANADQ